MSISIEEQSQLLLKKWWGRFIGAHSYAEFKQDVVTALMAVRKDDQDRLNNVIREYEAAGVRNNPLATKMACLAHGEKR
jgi:hypothetical protein